MGVEAEGLERESASSLSSLLGCGWDDSMSVAGSCPKARHIFLSIPTPRAPLMLRDGSGPRPWFFRGKRKRGFRGFRAQPKAKPSRVRCDELLCVF